MNVTRDKRVTCGVSNKTLPCPALPDPVLPGPAHLLLRNYPRGDFSSCRHLRNARDGRRDDARFQIRAGIR